MGRVVPKCEDEIIYVVHNCKAKTNVSKKRLTRSGTRALVVKTKVDNSDSNIAHKAELTRQYSHDSLILILTSEHCHYYSQIIPLTRKYYHLTSPAYTPK